MNSQRWIQLLFASTVVLWIVALHPSAPMLSTAAAKSDNPTLLIQITQLGTQWVADRVMLSGNGRTVFYGYWDPYIKWYKASANGEGTAGFIAERQDGTDISYDGSKTVTVDPDSRLLVNGVDITPCVEHPSQSGGFPSKICLFPVTESPRFSGNGQYLFYSSREPWKCTPAGERWNCEVNPVLGNSYSRFNGHPVIWRLRLADGATTQWTGVMEPDLDPRLHSLSIIEPSHDGSRLLFRKDYYWPARYTYKESEAYTSSGGAHQSRLNIQTWNEKPISFSDLFLSADGKWVAFEYIRAGEIDIKARFGLIQYNGGAETLVPLPEDFSFTGLRGIDQDGTTLLFAGGQDGETGLWLVESDGTNLTRVVSDTSKRMEYGTLSYDGKSVAFISEDDLIGNGNQSSQVFVAKGPAAPDLTVDPFELDPNKITFSGGRYRLAVAVTVRNSGEASASDIHILLRDNDGWSRTRVIPVLAADTSTVVQEEWDLTSLLVAGKGKASVQFTVTADPDDAIAETSNLDNRASAALDVDVVPRVLGVTPDYPVASTYFLDNASVPNQFRVEVDWNGAAPGAGSAPFGTVYFDLNGKQVQEAGQLWGASHTFDMGSDFQSSLTCANNTLDIWAVLPVADSEFTSLRTTLQPTVFPAPGWWEWITTVLSGGYYSFGALPRPPVVIYHYDYKYPAVPFVATWTPPQSVPYLGGRPLGVLQSQASVSATGQSTGAGTSTQSGATGFQVGQFGVMGSLSGGGETQFICGQSLTVQRSEFNLRVNGLVESEQGLADLIPGIRAAEQWPIVGRLIKWLNGIAKVKGQLMPGVEVQTTYKSHNDQLVFDQSQASAFIGTKAILEITPHKNLMADVYGGGEPYLTVWVPANPDYLKEVGIHLYYGADLRVFSFQQTFERKVSCAHPGGCNAPDLQLADAQLGWGLIPRNYAGPDYAVFRAGAESRYPEIVQASTVSQTLVSNIFPFPELSLAVDGAGHRLLVYVHDDTAKSHGRGNEIYALTYGGSNWSLPVPLTDDQQPDFSPVVAFDSHNTGLLLWQQSGLPPAIIPSLDITFARSLEIMARTWNGVSWSPPLALTSDSRMDADPQLAAGSDGSALALWKTSDGTDMLGMPGHPLTLTHALWNGAGWNSPAPALTGLENLLHTTLAVHTGGQAALVYSRDMDGELTDQQDTELFYSLFDGSGWTALAGLTSDTVTDTLPALAYDAGGNRHLFWLRDEKLVWLKNSWDMNAAQVLREGSGEGGLLAFRVSQSPDGNLALIWQMGHDGNTDLAYRVYDAGAGVWSGDLRLMSDEDVESAHSPAFGPDGKLHLAYQQTATELVTRTLSVLPGQSYTVTNLTVAGQSNLRFLSHTPGSDLTFDSLTVTPSNPTPGQPLTLTAVLRNAGDMAVAAPQVLFLDGNAPLADALTLGLLQGGVTTTVSLNWTPPAIRETHTLAALADPAGSVSENDEQNNAIRLFAPLPNLHIDAAYTTTRQDGVELTVLLANQGTVDVTSSFAVALRYGDAESGSLAAIWPVESRLNAGESITLTHLLTDTLTPGQGQGMLWVRVDDDDRIVESDETDNNQSTGFRVLPDLTVSGQDILGRSAGVAVTIHNRGIVSATNVVINGWQGISAPAAAQSATIGLLGPGQTQEVHFSADLGLSEFSVRIDPDNSLAETDESNNLAHRELVITTALYLPTLLR